MLVREGSYDYRGVTYRHLLLWCPGCDDAHMITVSRSDGAETWLWDGDTEAPTVSPSILVTGGGDDRTCHSFLRGGQWEYLTDSTHSMAGRTVPMVPIPDGFMD